MVELKHRRTGARVFKTIKEGDAFGEFYKFELFDEGELPQENATDEDAQSVRDELFKKLNEEAVIREAAVKAVRNKGHIDKLVSLIRSLLSSKPVQENKSEPPVQYYDALDLRDDGEQTGGK